VAILSTEIFPSKQQ